MTKINHSNFSKRLLKWYGQHGRKDFPWQKNINAYRVWISEIMLQQTQVNTVIPYFNQFMASFTTIDALAKASIDDVLHHWSGLGYYSRARNLHKTAIIITENFYGNFPEDIETLQTLPGIGRSTAGAIRATAFQKRAAILDGNVKRVLARHNAVPGWPGKTQVSKALWEVAESYTPNTRLRAYTQAIMDLGATVCSRSKPRCEDCPLNVSCQAKAQQRIEEFPGKKPKKILPVKTTEMLILQNDTGEVLLEQRPPTGIWGGLWSFPESRDITYGLQLKKEKKWPVVRHTFSHFHLDIQPVTYSGVKFKGVMDNKALLWYNINALTGGASKTDSTKNVGLAAPVSKLLKRLAAKNHP